MSDKNPKDEVKAKGSRRSLPVVASAVVLVCATTLIFANGNKSNDRQTAGIPDGTQAVNTQMVNTQTVIAPGESLVIPVSEITGEASFFPVTVDGEDMEVLAVRASDGSVRTAFNTCQSCYTSGAGYYRFEGGKLVCNNCGFRFSPDQVEVTAGGCNPWPIFDDNKTVTDDSISISYDTLSASKDIFANWKTSLR